MNDQVSVYLKISVFHSYDKGIHKFNSKNINDEYLYRSENTIKKSIISILKVLIYKDKNE